MADGLLIVSLFSMSLPLLVSGVRIFVSSPIGNAAPDMSAIVLWLKLKGTGVIRDGLTVVG